MKRHVEYCLIVEGHYFDISEAEHALRDPFIEEWVEQTGKFRIHNLDDIKVTEGISLGDLVITKIKDKVFEISSIRPGFPLNEKRAKALAEALRRQAIFDEIRLEPLNDPGLEA